MTRLFFRRRIWWLAAAALVIAVFLAARPHLVRLGVASWMDPTADVTVDTTRHFQTMTGWEVTAQAGQEDAPLYPQFRDSLLDLAVSDLGITRVRLWLRSGYENKEDLWQAIRLGQQREFRCGRFTTDNDNDDPNVIDPNGFYFSQLDYTIEQFVLPLKRRIEARGEKLYVNANYASFMKLCPPGSPNHHTTPEEYAEFVLASYLHLQSKYGFVPDAWEVILEPDNTRYWRGQQIGEAIVASARRLKEHGFSPRFIAPSNTRAANAVRYFDEMIRVPGVLDYLDEFSYHRYGVTTEEDIKAIGDRALRYHVKTSMLEHIASGYEDLHQDLKLGQVSAWQQFALAYPVKKDDGAQYYIISREPEYPHVRMAEQTRYLRQYFHFIRPGAVRVAATSDTPIADPVAFVGPGHRQVVVLKLDRRSQIAVAGLRPGTYGVRYTTRDQTNIAGKNVIAVDGVLKVSIPAQGVLTLYSLPE